VLTLTDVAEKSLDVIKYRSDEIAAVVVNPLQAFHPNSPPPSDLMLVSNTRKADVQNSYRIWLQAEHKSTLVSTLIWSAMVRH